MLTMASARSSRGREEVEGKANEDMNMYADTPTVEHIEEQRQKKKSKRSADEHG